MSKCYDIDESTSKSQDSDGPCPHCWAEVNYVKCHYYGGRLPWAGKCYKCEGWFRWTSDPEDGVRPLRLSPHFD
jgi:hypothetical protein